MTNMAVHFSSNRMDWGTPIELFRQLDREFRFTLDAAANAENAKCALWLGPGSLLAEDALAVPWTNHVAFLNPPYGSEIKRFVAKARQEALAGRATVVCLLPARTDTRWWHDHIWDNRMHRPREGVEVRLLPGRVRFVGAQQGAPFPSAVVIFHCAETRRELPGQATLPLEGARNG